MARTLYLIAYDVCHSKRLAKVGRYFHSYRVAGQKSVPEIWVTGTELQRIQHDLENLLNPHEDRLHIIALDPRQQRHCLGQAQTFKEILQNLPLCLVGVSRPWHRLTA